MIRRLVAVIFLLGLGASPCVLGTSGAAAEEGGAVAFEREPLVIEGHDGARFFIVEVARTPQQLAQGLMFRLELASDEGMLFDLGEERPVSMWMKNTLIPLDMLFVAADGRIRRIRANTTPLSLETIPSAGPVRAVIELPGGTAARLGIGVGDLVRHPLFGSPADGP